MSITSDDCALMVDAVSFPLATQLAHIIQGDIVNATKKEPASCLLTGSGLATAKAIRVRLAAFLFR